MRLELCVKIIVVYQCLFYFFAWLHIYVAGNKLILRIYYGTSRAEINWDGNSVAGNVDLSEA